MGGLVHVSQISQYRVDNCAEVLEVGESVWIKCVKVDEEGGKLSFAMRYVNQRDGTDLDPHNVELERNSNRRGGGGGGGRRRGNRTELGAVLPTSCKRCGGTGHM